MPHFQKEKEGVCQNDRCYLFFLKTCFKKIWDWQFHWDEGEGGLLVCSAFFFYFYFVAEQEVNSKSDKRDTSNMSYQT